MSAPDGDTPPPRPPRAARWHWRQALAFAGRFRWERVRERVQDPTAAHGPFLPRVSGLDWKLGVRMLVRYPGLSLIGGAALTIAIAIGAVWFEVLQEEFAPVLPLDDGDRIVRVENVDAERSGVAPRALYDLGVWRGTLRTVEELGAARTYERNLVTADAPPRPVRVAEITASAFPLTRVPPALGRPLLQADEQPGAPDVAVLGHDVWQHAFSGDSSVVGRTVQLGTTPTTVVGVMPEGFAFPRSQNVWIPLRASATAPGEGPGVLVFGRLADGATVDAAAVELDAVGRRLASAHPETHARLRPRVLPLAEEPRDGPAVIVLLGHLGVFMVLLAVCANVATLLFARTAIRESEMVVRNALGASRARIVTQLFVEALVLASLAAVLGLTLAAGIQGFIWHQTVVVRQVPQPFWRDGTLELATVVYAFGLAVLGAVLIGLLPGLKATGSRVRESLARAAAGGTGLRFGGVWSVIIVLQVALTVLCLPIGIGVTRETLRDHRIRSDFASQGFLTFRAELDRSGDGWDAAEAAELTPDPGDASEFRDRLASTYADLEHRLLEAPSVTAVTFAARVPATSHPLQRLEAQRGMEPPFPVEANTEGMVRIASVAPDFFQTFDVPIVNGRDFGSGDPGTPAVVVNESLASNLRGNPIGTRVRYAATEEDEEPGPWLEVVGVAKNLDLTPTDRGEADYLYHPAAPHDVYPASIIANVRGDAAELAPRIHALALSVDPSLRIYDPLPMDEVVRRQDLPMLVTTVGATVVVAMALVLSGAGLFALMAVAVARRTREIGIRVALGASGAGVLRAVFARAAAQVGIGILVGNVLVLVMAGFLARSFQALTLFGPMLGISATMALVGAAACAVPALRALRIQPTEALKESG